MAPICAFPYPAESAALLTYQQLAPPKPLAGEFNRQYQQERLYKMMCIGVNEVTNALLRWVHQKRFGLRGGIWYDAVILVRAAALARLSGAAVRLDPCSGLFTA